MHNDGRAGYGVLQCVINVVVKGVSNSGSGSRNLRNSR